MGIAVIKLKRFVNKIRNSVKNTIFSRSDFSYCGDNVFIHDGVEIHNPECLEIKGEVYIGPMAKIFSAGGISVGTGCVIGEGVQVMSSNHEYDSPSQSMLPFNNNNIKKYTVLSDYCWIGNNAIVLPGVKVGKFCVIGAGAVVTKNTEEFGIYGGNPAQLLKYRSNRDVCTIKNTWVESKNKDSIYFVK
ncbi:maltose O-acetyltransferase [Marinobacter sp. LV10R520-4]|uniref:acyltransferase n=1 Tax=Marinobacter sp. LV10R520-4 TaxID=1761796 RepID=UPI000BF3406E|nr:acyltransferase [Marinobacter sp. LV10R520-4]PFG53735.1 maltose O-acetyltransferase [Marinobacter sp. LV10R520-4]